MNSDIFFNALMNELEKVGMSIPKPAAPLGGTGSTFKALPSNMPKQVSKAPHMPGVKGHSKSLQHMGTQATLVNPATTGGGGQLNR